VAAVTRWARLAAALGFLGIAAIAHGEHQGQDADHRTGIRPSDAERCIYHAPGWEFYDATHPERCYATEGEARQDGCRRSFRR
jgi:hypothetical protein